MATNEIPTDDVVRRNIPRELPCKLTDEEFTRIAKQRATKEAERDELAADLAREKKKRQDQIDEIEDEIGKMGRELRTGYQDRTVKCIEVFRRGDAGVGYVHTMRTDTYEEVERRPATAHETQRYLPSIGGGSGGILDTARERQRSAQPEPSDVPADDAPSDVPEDEPTAKPKPEKFDAALLEQGKCALRYQGGAGCELEVGHDGLHKSAVHSWKARRPKVEE